MSGGTWALWNAGFAGLLGAAGVALAAVAAHRVADPSLATAAQFLIVHGAAALALAALSSGSPSAVGFLAAGSLMIFAVAVFSGDVTLRVFTGARLFPMAAPIGGSLLILAWLMAAVSGLAAAVRAG